MKKNYNYQICIRVYIVDTKHTITLKVSNHTTTKEISDRISNFINHDQFSTYYHIFAPDEAVELNPISTVQQNRIYNGTTLSAKIDKYHQGKPHSSYYTDKTKLISHDELHVYKPQCRKEQYGIILEGICMNKRCINYCKNVNVPLGCGEFNLHNMTENQKCAHCPYRDLHTNPPIIVKSIKLCNCYWRYYGQYREEKGYLASKEEPMFQKVQGECKKQLYKIIEQYRWTDLRIVVKQL